ncbi:MAG: hypothetical protein B7Y15_14515, partial [Bacteroidetes bacterium 24-39-8]
MFRKNISDMKPTLFFLSFILLLSNISAATIFNCDNIYSISGRIIQSKIRIDTTDISNNKIGKQSAD